MANFTSQPDESIGLDAQIWSYQPTVNFPAGTNILVGEHDTYTGAGTPQRFLLDFPSKPSGVASVTSATLKLYLEAEYSANARTLSLYLLKVPWVETQVTWNIRSTGNNWQVAGASGANDIGAAIGTLSLSATEAAGLKTITLNNALMRDWMNGLYYGVLGKVDGENDDYCVFTSSGGATAINRPKLEVAYVLQSGVPAVFLSDGFGVM